jgi:arsenate reductase (thioredoxin)
MQGKPKVLFFSMGNAVRSQMAEGFLRRMTGGQVEGDCTAVRPESDPLAVEVMREVGIDISQDQPKEIKQLFKEHFTCVVTLSDPAKERQPVWPFTRNLFHWKLPDPLDATGSTEQRREALRYVRDKIADNVRQFAGSVAPQLRARAAGAGK